MTESSNNFHAVIVLVVFIPVTRFQIVIRTVTSLLANQHVAPVSEMYVNVHVTKSESKCSHDPDDPSKFFVKFTLLL